MLAKQIKRKTRHKRVKSQIKSSSERPRLCVFRSNQHIYAQIINDDNGKILVSVSDLNIGGKKELKPKIDKSAQKELKKDETKNEKEYFLAFEVGKMIAKTALEKKISQVVFDRGGYKYHGKIKAVAQGAREGGLKF